MTNFTCASTFIKTVTTSICTLQLTFSRKQNTKAKFCSFLLVPEKELIFEGSQASPLILPVVLACRIYMLVQQRKQDMQLTLSRNIESCSSNHYCSGKAVSITHPECLFVDLGIQ